MKPTLPACALIICSTASAQEVVLEAIDGSVSLRGQLIEFSDQKYTLDTLAGILKIDSAIVTCSGEACPPIQSQGTGFSVEGTGRLATSLMADLLPGYAQSLDGQVSRADVSGAATFTVVNTENEELAKVSLADSSSSESLNNLLQEEVAIALTSRQTLSEETAEFENAGISIQSFDHEQIIGLEAIAIVTAENNPVDNISIRDAALVFSGTYTNWSELGGVDAPIKLYRPLADSELNDFFIASVIESQGAYIPGLSQDIVTTENVAARVANDPNGIGFTHFSKLSEAKPLAIQDICGLATPINNFTIKAEEYPLTQRFYAYSTSQPDNSTINDLLGFMQSDAGQTIIGSHGLIDQRGISNTIANQGTRFVNAINLSETDASGALLRDLVNQITNSERLSTTLRFETGTSKLDQKAKSDIIRLAEKLQSPDNAGTVVRLLGFTDSVGDFELNQELSLRRANLIRDALIEIDATLSDQVSILPSGLGEIAPIACNESAIGRSINRRIEVWISDADTLLSP